jgi:type III restriction enzyme
VSLIRSADLVLAVSQQGTFDTRPFDRFIEQLTVIGGEHQARAIRVASNYLLGGHYPSLLDLARENWAANEKIREKFRDEAAFLKAQQMGDLLAASIDHATATGKSFVIFGVAVVALASGQVDRVLVLCPSRTIEDGLTTKFRALAADPPLMELLPDSAMVKVPAIVNAYEGSVPEGAICVENIHAAYVGSLSSIRATFSGQGERTLVINDEAHHIYTTTTSGTKEWMTFLKDSTFGFRRVLNGSGTCFIGNDYFPDVIDRFGLQEARSERRIKDVYYWDTDGSEFPTTEARWSAVLEEHEKNRRRYAGIKPITIFVSQKIDEAKRFHEAFTEFLALRLKCEFADASKKTLVVSSREEHQQNVVALRQVDAPGDPVEYIFSVSMLTEGWDVKNVLQIVPEKRAFDSKLLIAQVLGRGLRLLPEPYRDSRVIVFNHAKWAPEMRRLFDDVWSDDERMYSTVVADSPHHFDLSQLELERGAIIKTVTPAKPGKTALTLVPQRKREVEGAFAKWSGGREERSYDYEEPVETIDAILADLETKDAATAVETKSWRASETPARRKAIMAALGAVGVTDGMVSLTNKRRIFTWLRPAARAGKRISAGTTKRQLVSRSTRDLAAQSRWRSELNRDGGIALRIDGDRAVRWTGHAADYDLLDSIVQDETLSRATVRGVTAEGDWRTPVDVVLVSFRPERDFLKSLLERGPAAGVTSWIKSPDKGFYSIDFSRLTAGGTPRTGSFNPDWFLTVGDDVLVVETKAANDVSDENKAKLRDASAHFAYINELREEAGSSGRYHFYFLAPGDYKSFFEAIGNNSYAAFLPTLQAVLR